MVYACSQLMHRVKDEMGLPNMTIAYGMTETSPISFQTGQSTHASTPARLPASRRVLSARVQGLMTRFGPVVKLSAECTHTSNAVYVYHLL